MYLVLYVSCFYRLFFVFSFVKKFEKIDVFIIFILFIFSKVYGMEEMEKVDGEWTKWLGIVWPVVMTGSGAVAAVFYFCFQKHSR